LHLRVNVLLIFNILSVRVCVVRVCDSVRAGPPKHNHARKPLCSWGLLLPLCIHSSPHPIPTPAPRAMRRRSPETLPPHLLSTTHILSSKRTSTCAVLGRCTASACEHACASGAQWKAAPDLAGAGRGAGKQLAGAGRADGRRGARSPERAGSVTAAGRTPVCASREGGCGCCCAQACAPTGGAWPARASWRWLAEPIDTSRCTLPRGPCAGSEAERTEVPEI
jgi:hypothetical protein